MYLLGWVFMYVLGWCSCMCVRVSVHVCVLGWAFMCVWVGVHVYVRVGVHVCLLGWVFMSVC